MDTAATLALLLDRVIDRADGRPDHETTSAILNEAARFAECHSDHRLRATPPSGSPVCRTRLRADGHRKAWRALEEAGWLGLTAPEEADGQRLPFASRRQTDCCTRPRLVLGRWPAAIPRSPTSMRSKRGVK
jgi:alkylation response protein AidB-like acyl-CoA dehydrogenase